MPSGKAALSHLTCLHPTRIIIHMRTTLNIDEQLLEQAAELSGVSEKAALVHSGLEALIALESARWLARLGGTEKISVRSLAAVAPPDGSGRYLGLNRAPAAR